MSILGLVLFLIVICAIIYFCDWLFPGMLTAEAKRLIWIVITVVVSVLLFIWVLQMFGVNLSSAANWGPHLEHP